MTLTRRALLLGATGAMGLTLAGCRRHQAAPAPQDPDRAAMEAAIAAERELIVKCDTAIGTMPAGSDTSDLVGARAQHVAHLAALGSHVGDPTPSRTPSLLPSNVTRTDLARATRTSAR